MMEVNDDMTVEVSRMSSALQKWHAKLGRQLSRTYTVEATRKTINSISWISFDGSKITLTNFDLKAILKIIEEGGYKV